MTFSEQTFETLAQYEPQFRTAINGRWCSNPGRTALQLMHNELDRIDGHVTRTNFNCSTCVLHIVERIGRLYFADKAEREAQDASEASQPAKTPAKSNNAKTRKK